MLKQRILTSLVLAPLALALAFYTPLTLFSYFAGAIVLMGAWEWSAFMGLCNKLKRSAFVLLVAALLALLNLHWPIESLWQDGKLVGDANYLFTLSFAWWIVASYLVWRYPEMAKAWNEGIVMRGIAGLLTLVPLWLALNTLRSAQYTEY